MWKIQQSARWHLSVKNDESYNDHDVHREFVYLIFFYGVGERRSKINDETARLRYYNIIIIIIIIII